MQTNTQVNIHVNVLISALGLERDFLTKCTEEENPDTCTLSEFIVH